MESLIEKWLYNNVIQKTQGSGTAPESFTFNDIKDEISRDDEFNKIFNNGKKGYKPDEAGKIIDKASEIKNSEGQYKRYTESCRTGAIAMLPGEMDYFMNLFRMIMEHFFGIDSTVC